MPIHIDTIICDDLRQEAGNKHSIMGIYGKDILVNTFPFKFNRICVIQKWRDLVGINDVRLQIKDEAGTTIFSPKVPVLIDEVDETATRMISFIIHNLEIEEEGKYIIETIFDSRDEPDYKHEILIKMMPVQVFEADISGDVPPTAHKAFIDFKIYSDKEGPRPFLQVSDNPELKNAVTVTEKEGKISVPVKNQKIFIVPTEGGISFKYTVKGYEEQI